MFFGCLSDNLFHLQILSTLCFDELREILLADWRTTTANNSIIWSHAFCHHHCIPYQPPSCVYSSSGLMGEGTASPVLTFSTWELVEVSAGRCCSVGVMWDRLRALLSAGRCCSVGVMWVWCAGDRDRLRALLVSAGCCINAPVRLFRRAGDRDRLRALLKVSAGCCINAPVRLFRHTYIHAST